MSGILPNNGVPPQNTQNGIADPDLAGGCDNLYYGPRCNPRLDPFAMNALISEIINALNALGIAYDCNRLDNLAGAFLQMDNAPIATPGGAPAAIIQHRLPAGTHAGVSIVPGSWIVRPFNVKPYDPGLIINLNANQFTPSVDVFCRWQTMFYQTLASRARMFNVTDNVVQDVSLSVYSSNEGFTGGYAEGTAFLTAGKVYQLEVRADKNADNIGPQASLGRGSTFGTEELYASINFWRMVA